MIATVISLLTGQALAWDTTVWGHKEMGNSSHNDFVFKFKAAFDHPLNGNENGEKLQQLCQGNHPALEYALPFKHWLQIAAGMSRLYMLNFKRE